MARRRAELVFLIHIWLAEEGGQPTWRASLESALTGEKQGFANLDELWAYIQQNAQDLAKPGPGHRRKSHSTGSDGSPG